MPTGPWLVSRCVWLWMATKHELWCVGVQGGAGSRGAQGPGSALIPPARWTPHGVLLVGRLSLCGSDSSSCSPLDWYHLGIFERWKMAPQSPWSQGQYTEVGSRDLHLKQAQPSRPGTFLGRPSPCLSSVSKFPFLDRTCVSFFLPGGQQDPFPPISNPIWVLFGFSVLFPSFA